MVWSFFKRKVNHLYSLILQIKCKNLDFRNNLALNLVFIRLLERIYFIKVIFVLNSGLYSKMGKWVLTHDITMIIIQDMYENGKPDIVLKTVKGFKIK